MAVYRKGKKYAAYRTGAKGCHGFRELVFVDNGKADMMAFDQIFPEAPPLLGQFATFRFWKKEKR